MSITAIPSSTFSPYQPTPATNTLQQEFQQLGQSLQSGNLSSAQSEFASLQQTFSQSVPSAATPSTAASSTSTSSPVTQSFNQLASDLKSGNLSAAQKDYSSIQQDFKARGGPLRNHFHDHGRFTGGGFGGDPTTEPTGSSTTPNSLLADFSQVGQSLSSGNPAVAQQAYASLQQELQQFALGGSLSAQTSTLLAQSPVSLEA